MYVESKDGHVRMVWGRAIGSISSAMSHNECEHFTRSKQLQNSSKLKHTEHCYSWNQDAMSGSRAYVKHGWLTGLSGLREARWLT